MKTFFILISLALGTNAFANPYPFLSSSEAFLMEHEVYRDSLFIVKDDFERFQERAFLVDREAMYIIKNQTFNPLDLAE